MQAKALSTYIKQYIIIWFAVPAIILILIGLGLLLNSVRTDISEQQKKNIQSVAMYLDAFFIQAKEDLGYAASVSMNKNEFRKSMAPFIINKTFYHRILLLNSAGRVIEVVPQEGIQDVFSGVVFLLDNETPVGLTPAYYSLQDQRIVVGMVRQTFYRRRLLLELNLSELQQYISKLALQLHGGVVFVTDVYGNLLAHPDMDLVRQQTNVGDIELLENIRIDEIRSGIVTYNEQLYFMSATRLSLSSWKVVSAQKVLTVLRPTLYATAFILVIVVSMVLMLIYVANKRMDTQIIQPLSQFTEIVKGIQRNKPTEKPFESTQDIKHTFEELESLSSGFERMHNSVVQREKELRDALKERDVLLKEMHHRVKNNLNVIASLLSLQSDQVMEAKDAKKALTESRNRIFSMALVHEDLYKSEKLSQVQMSSYIRSLLNELSGFYNQSGKIKIEAKIDEEINFDILHAVPCGIILNELLTNSFKHAFPGDTPGRITIKLYKSAENEYTLSVQDDGVGLPENFNNMSDESLGLKLVTILSEQLGGELGVSPKGPKEFKIVFHIE